jgi:hypothetical protein
MSWKVRSSPILVFRAPMLNYLFDMISVQSALHTLKCRHIENAAIASAPSMVAKKPKM